MPNRANRRSFLQTTAATGIGFWVAGGLMAKESKSPNERIAFGIIGIGGKGDSDSTDASKVGDLVAICDVEESALTRNTRFFDKAKPYYDFRKMLDEMGKSIDAVTVSTPDHTHAPAALMAMRMGKHCFCQKPLTRTLYETRLMRQVARESKVATQMGNQGTANRDVRETAAIVKSGVLGAVKEVHVWTNRPIWPQGGERPKSLPNPTNLAWDLWLGPAPARPFGNGYHPASWRGWWDFGSGALGDMACHTGSMPFMALNLRDPIAARADTSGHNGDSYPKWSVIEWEFGELNGRAPLKMFWYDGGKMPTQPWMGKMKRLFRADSDTEDDGEKEVVSFPSGCVVVGEKDILFAPGDYCGTAKLASNSPLPQVQYTESPGHFAEWIRAIKGGEAAVSNFPDYAGPLTETFLLGNLAVWAAASGEGERIEWDSKNLRATNMAGLESLIKPHYRAGFTLDV